MPNSGGSSARPQVVSETIKRSKPGPEDRDGHAEEGRPARGQNILTGTPAASGDARRGIREMTDEQEEIDGETQERE